MNLFTSMAISAKGLRAERTRLNIASMNLANAHVTRTLEGGPYRAKSVVFKAVPVKDLKEVRGLNNKNNFEAQLSKALEAVEVVEIVDDQTPFMEIFDPTHPDADENGIVKLPNVNVMEQMVDIIDAQRAYEANISAMEAAKTMAVKAIDIIR